MLKASAQAAMAAVYQNCFASKASLPRGRSAISFTFDDVPYSALEVGAPILEASAAVGTYYVAATFAEERAESGGPRHLSIDDVRSLHRKGHQIGCHTYSHRSLRKLSAAQSYDDASRNREFWRSALGIELTDFSYPFGEVTVRGKRALRDCYRSLRGNFRGINRNAVDLTYLRSTSLYSRELRKEKITALIDDCATNGGWLIFYTHGVEEDAPGPYDVTSADFRRIVEYSRRSGAPILSIEQARAHLLA